MSDEDASAAYREAVRRAVEALHGCRARWERTEDVRELWRGRVAWEGAVEVFGLTGHERARVAYAWGFRPGEGQAWEFVAVLEVPPVDSARTAVRVAIAAQARKA